DRIASLDIIILKMALAEFTDFPSIPVKVTINEYIEISKDYSTPRSRQFVNGMLDKLVADLRSEEKIKKTGRGLIE
ncbi:MAG TPA: transcription antitermination factor NusB, partial [Bacteroidales bacterium]|nr:transcription antitermination factor NusB [Bacteroidales bacterium]